MCIAVSQKGSLRRMLRLIHVDLGKLWKMGNFAREYTARATLPIPKQWLVYNNLSLMVTDGVTFVPSYYKKYGSAECILQ